MEGHAPHHVEQAVGCALHRPSMRVSKAAYLVEVDVATIYRAVRAGDIEAHIVGKRGIRVYADSLADYQRRNHIAPQPQSKPSRRNAQSRVPSQQHREAEAFLRAHGVL